MVHLWDLIFGDPGSVSPRMLDNLKMEAYIGGIVVAVVMLGIAALIAFQIPYEPGKNPRDPRKRRVWMIVLGVITLILLFIISILATNELTGRKADELQQATLIAVGISTVLYFALAFVLSKVFRRTKLGTWFPAKK